MKRGAIKECGACGKEIYFKPSRVRDAVQYCNHACRSKGLMTNQALTCIQCDKEYYCSRSQVRLRNRRTCSVKCRAELQVLIAKLKRELEAPTIGALNRRIRYSKEMQDWRKSVFERDNYTCQMCHVRGGYLQADHIKQFAYYPELRFDLSNGRTLCKPCHRKTPTYAKKAKNAIKI